MTQEVIWFNEYYTSALGHRLGGKGASLVGLAAGGLPVPEGYVVSTEAFESAVRESGLSTRIAERLAGLRTDDLDGLAAAAAEVRSWIQTLKLPAHVAGAVSDAYRRLQGDGHPPAVAVRSSASAEDLPGASFAGQLDSYPWVSGVEGVINAVERCWASLFTDRAVAYRLDHQLPPAELSMAVVVQRMIEAVASGVAFTINPATGDRSQIVVDAAWGAGEGVVAGLVTPDHYRIDKVMDEIIETVISHKEHEIVRGPDGHGSAVRALEPGRADAPCLSDGEVRAVAAVARRCEQVFGRPQDVEWVLEEGPPGARRVLLVQSRPETVWSRRPRRQVIPPGAPTDALHGVLDALMSPTRAAGAVGARP